MTVASLKKRYWNLLHRCRKWRHPSSINLSPHPWMQAIANLLPNDLDQVIYVDGGAHDGEMAKRFHQRFPNLQAHAFEPNADLFPALEQNLADIPGSRHMLALSDQPRTLDFIVNDSPMTSSVLPRNELSVRYFDAATTPRETRKIRATTLDHWFAQSQLPRVDILKLDLQGYEAHALRGATRMLDTGVRCVFAEVNFQPFYDGSALFADVDALLRERGYRLHNLYNLCTHLPKGELGSADALWVRQNASIQSCSQAA